MRKKLVFILLIFIAILLAGCGNRAEPTGVALTAAKTAPAHEATLAYKVLDDSEERDIADENEDMESEIARLQAFLNGTWAWYFSEGIVNPAVVELTVSPDGTGTGIVVKAGGDLAKYGFEKGDIYWRDFEFRSGDTFTCYNLTKIRGGSVVGATADVTVDYDNEVLHMHLTSFTGLTSYLTSRDRDWVRYEEESK